MHVYGENYIYDIFYRGFFKKMRSNVLFRFFKSKMVVTDLVFPEFKENYNFVAVQNYYRDGMLRITR